MPAMVESDSLPATFEIMLALNRPSTYDNLGDLLHQNGPSEYQSIVEGLQAMLGGAALVYALSPLCLCLHNLPHVHTLQSVAREGTACGITDISFDESPVRFMEAPSCDANMAHMVYCLQTSSMADKEHWFKHFTCCQLKSFKNWPDWDNAFDAQLDAHCKAGCIGVPVPQSMAGNGCPPNVLHIHWMNSTKTDCQLRHHKNWPDWDKVLDAQLGSHCKVDCIGIPPRVSNAQRI